MALGEDPGARCMMGAMVDGQDRCKSLLSSPDGSSRGPRSAIPSARGRDGIHRELLGEKRGSERVS